MKRNEHNIGKKCSALNNYRLILGFLTLFLALSSGRVLAQACSGIQFSFENPDPCLWRLQVQTSSECYPFIRLLLDDGEFTGWSAGTGWTAEQISPTEILLTHNSGMVPLGFSVPIGFTIPPGISPTVTFLWDDTCAMVSCETGIAIEACTIVADACIIGTKYRECHNLPFSNQPVLSGWMITLTDALDNVLDSMLTDDNGAYFFCDLAPGNYYVKETNQPGWTPNVPASGKYFVSLSQSETENRDFGNCPSCSCDSIDLVVLPVASNSPDTCSYQMAVQNTDGGYCYQNIRVAIGSGQIVSWMLLEPNWEVVLLDSQHIQLNPVGGFMSIGTAYPLKINVTGSAEYAISISSVYNTGSGDVECKRTFVYQCPVPGGGGSQNCCPAGAISGPELVTNGDFESGNTGFTTGPPALSYSNVCIANSYVVDHNFTAKCSTWPSLFDNTTGNASGHFMAIDGNNQIIGPYDVWNSTVPVVPGTKYCFSFWAASVHPQFIGVAFMINGVQMQPPVVIVQSTPTWTFYSVNWTCPAGVGPTIPIAIRQLSPGGLKDFGLDDISFHSCTTPPPCQVSINVAPLNNCGLVQVTANANGPQPISFQWCDGRTDGSYTTQLLCNVPATYCVTATCSDASTASDLVTYVVSDPIPPVAVCNPGIGVDLGTNCSFQVTPAFVDGGSSDNCPNFTMSVSPTVLPSCTTTTVTLTVTDWCGNTSTCTMGIQTIEGVPPVIACPPNQTVGTDPGVCWYTYTPPPPIVADNCDPNPVVDCTWEDPMGTILPLTGPVQMGKGGNTIRCNAKDHCDNESGICTYVITVADTEQPVLSCPQNLTIPGVPLIGGSCEALVNNIAPTATDNCPIPSLTYLISSTGDTGVDDASGETFPEGLSTVTYSLTDCGGFTKTCSFTILVVCPRSCISGVKYEECEQLPFTNQPTLSGWTISLLDSMLNVLDTMVTGADGAYTFCDLPPGQYIVRETQKPGWTANVPASGQSIITLGQSEDAVRNFGNCPAIGCSDVTFAITQLEPCLWSLQDSSRNNACYPFIRLLLGSGEFNTWTADTQNGWMGEQISPTEIRLTHSSGHIPEGSSSPINFSLIPGTSPVLTILWDNVCPPTGSCSAAFQLTGCPILADGCISGLKYEECDQLPYTNQPLLSGWTISLLDTMLNVLDTMVTGVDGAYTFCDLPPGQYIVRETQKPGWTSNVPASGQYAISLGQSEMVVRNFGNCPSSGCTDIAFSLVNWEPCRYRLHVSNNNDTCYAHIRLQLDGAVFATWNANTQAGWSGEQLSPTEILLQYSGGLIPAGMSDPIEFSLPPDSNGVLTIFWDKVSAPVSSCSTTFPLEACPSSCLCGTFSNTCIRSQTRITCQPIFCGGAAMNLNCPISGYGYDFTGQFNCQGACTNTPISWQFSGPGGTFSGSLTASPFFAINLLPTYFSVSGLYTLTLQGSCDGSSCVPCVFQFNINCPNQCPCDPVAFPQEVAQGFANVLWTNSCQACFSPIALNDCDIVEWYINNGPVEETTNGSESFCHTFSGGAGAYSITMTVFRKNSDGTPCGTSSYSRIVAITCLSWQDCSGAVNANPRFSEGAVAGGLNSGGASAGWVALSGDPHVLEGQPLGTLDGWAMYLTGNLDSSDIVSSAAPVCVKDSGLVSVRLAGGPIGGADVKGGRKPPGGNVQMILYQGNNFDINNCSNCYRLANIEGLLPLDSNEWVQIQVPYDLSNWQTMEHCGDGSAGKPVRIAVFVTGAFGTNQGGLENGYLAELDNICLDGQLVAVKTPGDVIPLRIFPNPNPGLFNVELPEPAKPGMSFRIVGITGQRFLEQPAQTGESQQTVLAGELPPGLYFLQVLLEGKVLATEKFVKQ